MDIANLTQSEVEALIQELSARLGQLRDEARNLQDARTGRIEDSITALDGLLGPEGAEPGVDSIRAVLGYDGETMAQNAHITLPLIVTGMLTLTTTVRDIAASIEHNQ